jgi:hypothetical protein
LCYRGIAANQPLHRDILYRVKEHSLVWNQLLVSSGTLYRAAPVKTDFYRELDSGGAVQQAHFAVRREAYPCYELGRFKSLVNLKMGAIYSSETSVLNRSTW